MNFLQECLLEVTGTCCIGCLIKKLFRYKKFILIDIAILFSIFRNIKSYKVGLLLSMLYLRLNCFNFHLTSSVLFFFCSV